MMYESKLSEWLCFGETEDEADDLSESGRVTAEAPSAGRGEGSCGRKRDALSLRQGPRLCRAGRQLCSALSVLQIRPQFKNAM